MKLYNPNRLSVIFLVPVVMAASGGGCSTTPEPGPLAADQVVEAIAGNTVQIPDEEIYAYAAEDGSLRGMNLPRGGKVGNWRVDEDSRLCASYREVDNGAETCSTLSYVDENQFVWRETSILLVEGNPKDL